MEGGSRPLYDAVRFAVDYTVQHAANTNRSVLVLTGGNDADSTHSLDQAVERANQQGVTLHAVALSNNVNLAVLADMAARTGGSISRATDARQLVWVRLFCDDHVVGDRGGLSVSGRVKCIAHGQKRSRDPQGARRAVLL